MWWHDSHAPLRYSDNLSAAGLETAERPGPFLVSWTCPARFRRSNSQNTWFQVSPGQSSTTSSSWLPGERMMTCIRRSSPWFRDTPLLFVRGVSLCSLSATEERW